MSEREEGGPATVELLLLEPEIVAWLDDYRRDTSETPDDDPLEAA